MGGREDILYLLFDLLWGCPDARYGTLPISLSIPSSVVALYPLLVFSFVVSWSRHSGLVLTTCYPPPYITGEGQGQIRVTSGESSVASVMWWPCLLVLKKSSAVLPPSHKPVRHLGLPVTCYEKWRPHNTQAKGRKSALVRLMLSTFQVRVRLLPWTSWCISP